MKLKSNTNDYESRLHISNLTFLAISQLSIRQIEVLRIINSHQGGHATMMSEIISVQLECSRSTIWNIFRSLYDLRLLDYGVDKKGRRMSLTDTGRLIALQLNSKC